MAGGWGSIVAGTYPGKAYQGFQDAQTQEINQERAGLVNEGLQYEAQERKANQPIVDMSREMQKQDIEDEQRYNALVRDFLPVARQAKVTDNPDVIAQQLNHYIPDGISSYKGSKVVDPRTGTKRYLLTDGRGETKEFSSIDEMLEVPLMFSNRKNFQSYLDQSRKARIEAAQKADERRFELGKMGVQQQYKLGEMEYGSGLKREESTHQAGLDVQKARLTPTDEMKNTEVYMQTIGADPVQANMIMNAVKRGDEAAYQRAVLAAAGNIFQNSLDTESAQQKVDGLKAYADKLRKSSSWGSGGGGAGSGGAGGGVGSSGPPPDAKSVYDQIKAKYQGVKSDAEIKKAAEAISQRLSQGAAAPGAQAGGGGLTMQPSQQQQPQLQQQRSRTIQELDEMELPSTGDGTTPSSRQAPPTAPFRAPSVPSVAPTQSLPTTPTQPPAATPQNQQGASLGSRILSAFSPGEAYAAGGPGGQAGQASAGAPAENTMSQPGAATGDKPGLPWYSQKGDDFLLRGQSQGLPNQQGRQGQQQGGGGLSPGVVTAAKPLTRQGEGGARGLTMNDYAPEVWQAMPVNERTRYVMEREQEIARQREEDAFAALPLSERVRIAMQGQGREQGQGQGQGQGQRPGAPLEGSVRPGGETFQRQPIPTPLSLQSQGPQVRQSIPAGNQGPISNVVRQPMPTPLSPQSQGAQVRQPMPTPLAPQSQGLQVRQPVQGQTPGVVQAGVSWAELPARDRIDDMRAVVEGAKSYGVYDRIFFEAVAMAEGDVQAAADLIALGIRLGKIPDPLKVAARQRRQ